MLAVGPVYAQSADMQAIKHAEVKRAPTAKPEFTLGTIRKAIPPHCFERRLLKSSLHLAADVALVSLMFWGSSYINQAPAPLPSVLWPLYWFFQGAVMTGVWVIAHGERYAPWMVSASAIVQM